MKFRKLIIINLVICVILFILNNNYIHAEENEINGYELLRQTLMASRKVDYISENANPFKDLQNYSKVRLFRKVDENDGFICIRMEFWGDNDCKAILLKNRDGEFAVDGKGRFAFRGIEFFHLYFYENLNNDFYENEMKNASYSLTEGTFYWQSCYSLKVQIPVSSKNVERNEIITGIKEMNVRKMFATHCYRYEYVIHKNTQLIQCVKRFSGYGRLIKHIELGKVTCFPDWEKYSKIFDTPKNICGWLQSDKEFFRLCKRLDIRK